MNYRKGGLVFRPTTARSNCDAPSTPALSERGGAGRRDPRLFTTRTRQDERRHYQTRITFLDCDKNDPAKVRSISTTAPCWPWARRGTFDEHGTMIADVVAHGGRFLIRTPWAGDAARPCPIPIDSASRSATTARASPRSASDRLIGLVPLPPVRHRQPERAARGRPAPHVVHALPPLDLRRGPATGRPRRPLCAVDRRPRLAARAPLHRPGRRQRGAGHAVRAPPRRPTSHVVLVPRRRRRRWRERRLPPGLRHRGRRAHLAARRRADDPERVPRRLGQPDDSATPTSSRPATAASSSSTAGTTTAGTASATRASMLARRAPSGGRGRR